MNTNIRNDIPIVCVECARLVDWIDWNDKRLMCTTCAKKGIIIKLDEKEIEFIKECSEKIRENKLRNGRYLQPVDKERKNTLTDDIGVAGEYVMCKYMNIPYKLRLFLGGDGGEDLSIRGKIVDVKTCQNHYPHLKVMKKDYYKKTDLYVNIRQCNYPNLDMWEIIGWISKKEFLEKSILRITNKNYPDKPMYVVDRRDLRSVFGWAEAYNN
jgi:hypothetical protein